MKLIFRLLGVLICWHSAEINCDATESRQTKPSNELSNPMSAIQKRLQKALTARDCGALDACLNEILTFESKDKVADRSTKMLLFAELSRGTGAIISKKGRPGVRGLAMNVTPPTELHLPAGVDPKEIANPKLQAQYKRDIEENRRRVHEFDRLTSMKNVNELALRLAIAYAAQAYGQSQAERAALKKDVAGFNDPDGILREVHRGKH